MIAVFWNLVIDTIRKLIFFFESVEYEGFSENGKRHGVGRLSRLSYNNEKKYHIGYFHNDMIVRMKGDDSPIYTDQRQSTIDPFLLHRLLEQIAAKKVQFGSKSLESELSHLTEFLHEFRKVTKDFFRLPLYFDSASNQVIANEDVKKDVFLTFFPIHFFSMNKVLLNGQVQQKIYSPLPNRTIPDHFKNKRQLSGEKEDLFQEFLTLNENQYNFHTDDGFLSINGQKEDISDNFFLGHVIRSFLSVSQKREIFECRNVVELLMLYKSFVTMNANQPNAIMKTKHFLIYIMTMKDIRKNDEIFVDDFIVEEDLFQEFLTLNENQYNFHTDDGFLSINGQKEDISDNFFLGHVIRSFLSVSQKREIFECRNVVELLMLYKSFVTMNANQPNAIMKTKHFLIYIMTMKDIRKNDEIFVDDFIVYVHPKLKKTFEKVLNENEDIEEFIQKFQQYNLHKNHDETKKNHDETKKNHDEPNGKIFPKKKKTPYHLRFQNKEHKILKLPSQMIHENEMKQATCNFCTSIYCNGTFDGYLMKRGLKYSSQNKIHQYRREWNTKHQQQ